MKIQTKIIAVLFLFMWVACSKDDNEVQVSPETNLEPETPEVENKAPLDFELIAPTDNGPNADLSVIPTLSWSASTDPDGDTVNYDLYIDPGATADQLYAENLTATSFVVTERLALLQNYVWRVVAKDLQGAMTSSTTSNFSTRSIQFSDGPIRENADFPARGAHSTAVFDNKLWVIGGLGDLDFFNDVWFSSDGVNWTEATDDASFPARYAHTSVVFDNKIWVIGGVDANFNLLNDVWFSEDGVAWQEATSAASFSVRALHNSVVFDNKIWVIGGRIANGSFSDVWFSEDGINWTEATSSAAFDNRFGHSSEVFDNKLWVIGGVRNNLGNQNDVWFSEDGIAWSQASNATSFTNRSGHTSVVFDNKLWVIGGSDGTRKNDVWFSSDAIVWEEVASEAPFVGRTLHTTVVFDNKVWIIGGNDGESINDVWTFD